MADYTHYPAVTPYPHRASSRAKARVRLWRSNSSRHSFIHSLIHPPFADSCLIAMTCFCACSFSSFSTTTTSYWGAHSVRRLFQPARPRPAPSGTNRIALLFTFVHICSQPPSIIHHHRVSYKLVSIKLHSLIVPSTCPLWTLCVAAAVPWVDHQRWRCLSFSFGL